MTRINRGLCEKWKANQCELKINIVTILECTNLSGREKILNSISNMMNGNQWGLLLLLVARRRWLEQRDFNRSQANVENTSRIAWYWSNLTIDLVIFTNRSIDISTFRAANWTASASKRCTSSASLSLTIRCSCSYVYGKNFSRAKPYQVDERNGSFIQEVIFNTMRLWTRLINRRSGRSMVLAIATTINQLLGNVGQLNRLYRTACCLVHKRSSWKKNAPNECVNLQKKIKCKKTSSTISNNGSRFLRLAAKRFERNSKALSILIRWPVKSWVVEEYL